MATVDNEAAVVFLKVIDGTLEDVVSRKTPSQPLEDLNARKHLTVDGVAERLAFTPEMRGIAASAQFPRGKALVDLYAQSGDRNNMATGAYVTRGRLPILDRRTVTVYSNFDNIWFDGTPQVSDVNSRFTTSRWSRKFGGEQTTFSYGNRYTGHHVEAHIDHGHGRKSTQVTERSTFR